MHQLVTVSMYTAEHLLRLSAVERCRMSLFAITSVVITPVFASLETVACD